MELTVYHPWKYFHQALDRFQDAIEERALQFKASELAGTGLMDASEVASAVEKAIKVCQAGGISLRGNFRKIYIVNPDGIVSDWMLSSLARKLVVLNANAGNPVIARVQLSLLERI